jgi:1-acyl-sn-glycerol-3-phosphate acyltransferase
MSLKGKLAQFTLKAVLDIATRVHLHPMGEIPWTGPLIVIINHINSLDAPMMMTYLQPRPIVPLGKEELWDSTISRILMDHWGGIPIRRGEADMSALQASRQALKKDCILAIAPEGTRSEDGRLQQGKPGVLLLAMNSGVPILPLAHYGGEEIFDNLRRLRRTDFHIVSGNVFTLDMHGQKPDRDQRQLVTDEIMYQLAALLPERYRGYYADLSKATEQYLKFEPGAQSNLAYAEELAQGN